MSAIGTLVVQVYTSAARIPVEGATVLVTGQDAQGSQQLISLQTTNSSGFTEPIAIETPMPGNSTAPLPEGSELPYVQCSVWAEREGFVMLQTEGVQIFPGVQTVQPMKLVPLCYDTDCSQIWDTREITSQKL